MAMSDALKNILMQRAMAGGGGQGMPGGSRPMPGGAAGGMPVGRVGGGANPMAAKIAAAMAAKGGKGRPAPKGKAAPRKPAPSKGKAPAKGKKAPANKKAAR